MWIPSLPIRSATSPPKMASSEKVGFEPVGLNPVVVPINPVKAGLTVRAPVPTAPSAAAPEAAEANKDEKKKKHPLGAYWPCFVLLTIIAALAIGLGVGLGVSKKDDNSAGPLQSVINVVYDAQNTILTDTNITDIRCSLANATGVPMSQVLLVSWTDASSVN